MTNCDCCRVLLGYSEYTIIKEHDTQLFICEDCLLELSVTKYFKIKGE